MDAFAVAVCKGLATERARFKNMLVTGAWFGGFQALMPLIGYFLGAAFASYITSFDHWIAFVLLAFIGINMLREAIFEKDEDEGCPGFCPSVMLPMALATSIDALAVGVTYALLPDVNIFLAVGSIGVITFLLSALGVKLGNLFGARYKKGAEILGGAVLVFMGIKILVEHLVG